jgi:hypothetical protein
MENAHKAGNPLLDPSITASISPVSNYNNDNIFILSPSNVPNNQSTAPNNQKLTLLDLLNLASSNAKFNHQTPPNSAAPPNHSFPTSVTNQEFSTPPTRNEFFEPINNFNLGFGFI